MGVAERLDQVDLHGLPATDAVRRLRPNLSPSAIRSAAARQMALQYDDVGDLAASPGALELLATVERLGLPWAIVTSADRRLAHARLQAAGIVAPAVLVTVEDVSAGKPDPEGFLLAARRLGIPPEQSLVVEDSASGIEAGRRAGALTATLRGLDGDIPIGGLSELAHRLATA